jgi:hypothetical protein
MEDKNMLKMLCSVLLLIFAVGCGPHYVDYFPYHDNGMAKPAVAVLPIINHTDFDCAWDLSKELSDELNDALMDNAQLFIFPEQKTLAAKQRVGNVDFFAKDLSFAKYFCPSEFLVVMELIEHRFAPYEPGKFTPLYPIDAHSCNLVLVMKIRIRMIDLRGNTPCIVLQEIFQSNHMLPKDGDQIDYAGGDFGIKSYEKTPLSIAHQRLSVDLAKRIERIAYTAR